MVAAGAGVPAVGGVVYCPRENASVDAERCTTCSRLRAMTWTGEPGGAVTCAPGTALPEGGNRRMDFTEAAARRRLHEVAEPILVCIAASATVGEARGLLAERRIRALCVVDAERKLVGIVARSDLLGAAGDWPVRDVMTAPVHALPENAPIGYAIALMAIEKVSEIPIVTEDEGEVIGLWHAHDALEWTARQLGYVLAEAGTSPPERA